MSHDYHALADSPQPFKLVSGESAAAQATAQTASAACSAATSTLAFVTGDEVEGGHVTDLREEGCGRNSNISPVGRDDRQAQERRPFRQHRQLRTETDGAATECATISDATQSELSYVAEQIGQHLATFDRIGAELAQDIRNYPVRGILSGPHDQPAVKDSAADVKTILRCFIYRHGLRM